MHIHCCYKINKIVERDDVLKQVYALVQKNYALINWRLLIYTFKDLGMNDEADDCLQTQQAIKMSMDFDSNK